MYDIWLVEALQSYVNKDPLDRCSQGLCEDMNHYNNNIYFFLKSTMTFHKKWCPPKKFVLETHFNFLLRWKQLNVYLLEERFFPETWIKSVLLMCCVSLCFVLCCQPIFIYRLTTFNFWSNWLYVYIQGVQDKFGSFIGENKKCLIATTFNRLKISSTCSEITLLQKSFTKNNCN